MAMAVLAMGSPAPAKLVDALNRPSCCWARRTKAEIALNQSTLLIWSRFSNLQIRWNSPIAWRLFPRDSSVRAAEESCPSSQFHAFAEVCSTSLRCPWGRCG